MTMSINFRTLPWLAVLALSTGCAGTNARLPHKWSKLDMALGAAFVAASVVDWHQTSKDGGITDRCIETNPVIGACGGRVPTYVYFPVIFVYGAAAASVLDDNYRTALLAGMVGVEGSTIWQNHNYGTPRIGW